MNTPHTRAPSDSQISPLPLMEASRCSAYLLVLAFVGLLLCSPAASAQPAQLVKDINPGADSSNATGIVEVGGTILFTATDGTNGFELWETDGTESGTQLFKDINSGSAPSVPLPLTLLDGTLYFAAQDGTNGLGLWKTDGTPTGTQLVKVINPSTTANPLQQVGVGVEQPFNGMFFFIANDGSSGKELWVSDGTAGGTTLLKDINSGSDGSGIIGTLTPFNGALYFGADDGSNGDELWKTDGTTSGTELVKDINTISSVGSGPAAFTVFDGALYFSADDGSTGRELWKTDGTTSGTERVTDINSGPASSAIFELAVFDGNLYFGARDGTNGSELWKSDGTTGGTQLVKEINPDDGVGEGDSGPAEFTPLDGTLYFLAAETAPSGGPSAHQELWKTDGTASGTEKVTEINSGDAGAFPIGRLRVLNGNLVFPASNEGSPQDPLSERNVELWRSDGTAGGTQLVADINSGTASSLPLGFARSGDMVFFTATDANNGRELWKIGADRLPVELASFEARRSGEGAVRLTWQTASETNNSGFAVQRQTDPSTSWTTVHFVEGAGTTSEPQSYQFTDQTVPYEAETIRYRLKQVDLDGTTDLSNVVEVNLSVPDQLALRAPFPNPSQGQATIRYELPEATEVQIAVYDLLGRRVATPVEGRRTAGRAEVQLRTQQLPSGTYILRLQAAEQTRTQRLTVVK